MDMGFDLYAMVRPKTRDDFIALLDEALSELQTINGILDAVLLPPPPAEKE